MSNTTIIKGNLGRPGELRFTQSGRAVFGFSLADTPRKKNDQGQWEDAGETLWVDVSVWGDDATELAERMADFKGQVTVTGRLGVRSYEGRDGTQRTQVTLNADSVALHPKQANRQAAPHQSGGWGQQQGTAEPWTQQQPAPAGGGWMPAGASNDEPPFAP